MDFGDLLEIVRDSGFDVVDANGLPIGEEMENLLDDDNLLGEPVHVNFRTDVRERERAIVADIQVGEEIYYLVGHPRNVEELRTRLGGEARPGDEPWD